MPTPNELRRARRSRGLTQTQAAAVIGVTLRTWMAWEASPNAATRRKMPARKWIAWLAAAPKEKA